MDNLWKVKVDEKRNRIFIQCDRELLMEISHILNSLIDMTRIVRNRQVLTHREEQRREAPIRTKKERAARKHAADVYKLYMDHLQNGCAGNKAQAIRATAADLDLLMVDVRVFLQIYREA